ncbi:MAG: isoprenyl transferase [Acidimicrobiales bacterium]
MDGNGRWASRKGLARTEGHRAGEESLFDVVEGALDLGIPWLSVYAFSTENWRRPADEVRFLMHVMSDTILGKRRQELHDRGVRVTFAGRRDWRVPKRVLRHMDEVADLTRANDRLTFVIAFNYGGRAEIVDAVRALVADGVPAERIDERAISSRLYQPGMPDPDLVIRTSGEFRVSNFWLWELAYSELVFTDTLWPDYRREDLFASVREYQSRDRRFGAVGDRDEGRE